ncbi:MAG: hypothetical protein PWP66_586 [Thermosediminibacterales bacterium]|nr:hypothetical protein [Thermosediminibacterales bacterium]
MIRVLAAVAKSIRNVVVQQKISAGRIDRI